MLSYSNQMSPRLFSWISTQQSDRTLQVPLRICPCELILRTRADQLMIAAVLLNDSDGGKEWESHKTYQCFDLEHHLHQWHVSSPAGAAAKVLSLPAFHGYLFTKSSNPRRHRTKVCSKTSQLFVFGCWACIIYQGPWIPCLNSQILSGDLKYRKPVGSGSQLWKEIDKINPRGFPQSVRSYFHIFLWHLQIEYHKGHGNSNLKSLMSHFT